MADENITFDKLQQAVGFLREQLERILKIVVAFQHNPYCSFFNARNKWYEVGY